MKSRKKKKSKTGRKKEVTPMRLKIGIVGIGMVGTPVKRWLEEVRGYKRGKDLFLYDTNPTLGYTDDVNLADVAIICVPTPRNPNGSCNTSIVESAARDLRDDIVIAIKSTITPGTTLKLQRKYPKKSFLFWPEFLTEKRAWEDFTGACGRQIVAHTGKNINEAFELLRLLPITAFMRPHRKNYEQGEVNSTEAELAKYFANVFGASKVTFGNGYKDICEALGIVSKSRVEYENVRDLVGADPRINDNWLDVSHGDYRGFGGYCFPKDLEAHIFFLKDTIKLANAKKGNAQLTKRLKAFVNILEKVWDYNELLLSQQGLSVENVSKHDEELAGKIKKLK